MIYNWFKSTFEKWIGVLLRPRDTFKSEKANATLEEGAKFILLAGVATSIFVYLELIQIYGEIPELASIVGVEEYKVMVIFTALTTPLWLLVEWLIVSIILILFAKVLKGKGDLVTQSYLLALFGAPFCIIYIPTGFITSRFEVVGRLVDLLFFVYGLCLLTLALKETHEYGTKRAAVTWLIPLLIWAVIFIGI